MEIGGVLMKGEIRAEENSKIYLSYIWQNKTILHKQTDNIFLSVEKKLKAWLTLLLLPLKERKLPTFYKTR